MLFYIYSDAPGSTIDITDRCRLTSPFSVKDQAEEGSVALSSLVIDDPDGDLEITGHRRIYIYESEAPAFDQVVFNGFIANEREARGPYRTGAGSQWTVDLSDPNVLINRRIMNGADANRPAETDVERIAALLTMTELNTVDDSLYFSTADPVDMDAVNYLGQNVGAYIDDCRQASGKNAYIWYNEAESAYSLWYDFSDSSEYDSGCFLTNGIGEGNGTSVFEISQERTYLNHDPSRVASGVYLEYDGGSVYVQDSGTLAQFAAIDWAAPSLNVKSLTKATARANRYLSEAATEQDIIHVVMTKVPRRSVNAVKKGQLVSFKASYMLAYTGYTVCRVLYRTVTEISEDPENSFEIEMDLVPLGESEPLFMMLGRSAAGFYGVSEPAFFGDGQQLVGWYFTGDDVEAGWTVEPTIGPVEAIPYPEGEPSLILWRGIRVLADGTASIEHQTGFGGVTNGAGEITVTIRQNGTIISTQTQIDPFPPDTGLHNFFGAFTFALSGIAATAGDEFEVGVSWAGSWAFEYYAQIPPETNEASHFRVIAS